MRAGGVLLLAGLIALLSLSSCVSGPRRFGGDGPPVALQPHQQQQPQALEQRPARRPPYRPEVLSVGSARLSYGSARAPTPTRTIEVSAAPPPLPVTTPQRHVVAPGETLFAIARARLGDESRWRDILAANPGLESPQLKAGQTITIPR